MHASVPPPCGPHVHVTLLFCIASYSASFPYGTSRAVGCLLQVLQVLMRCDDVNDAMLECGQDYGMRAVASLGRYKVWRPYMSMLAV